MSSDGDPPLFGWCALAAFAGFGLSAADRIFHQSWAGLPGAILLIGAGVVAMAGGWYAGVKPPPETRADSNLRVNRGLVGTQILLAHMALIVVDDSASGGDKFRRSVVAVDPATGKTGLLFIELDRRGRVVAAALPGHHWIPATARAPLGTR